MPSFAPSQPTKKLLELTKRETELIHAIRKNLPLEKLTKSAEKYRKAQLSLFKAKIHVALEEVYKKRLDKIEFDSLKKDISLWENKSTEQIILEFKILKKLDNKGL